MARRKKLDEREEAWARARHEEGWTTGKIARELTTLRVQRLTTRDLRNPFTVKHAQVSRSLIAALIRS